MIFCKSSDKTVVEWSLKDINKPLCISIYQIEQVVARTERDGIAERRGAVYEGRKHWMRPRSWGEIMRFDLFSHDSWPCTLHNCLN